MKLYRYFTNFIFGIFMPTPNTYDFKNFRELLKRANSLFHQTSINNLSSILSQGIIYSPATQWGVSPISSTARYTPNPQRLKNLNRIASRGFVDYVFCSFENGIQRKNKTYGVVGIEIQANILLDRESFIYPINFIFGWDGASLPNRFSDLSTWNAVITNRKLSPYNEVLVRRKIILSTYLVKFHCFEGISKRVLPILDKYGYNAEKLQVYPNITAFGSGHMEIERLAIIEGVEYKALLSADGKLASIYNIVSSDDLDFLGQFAVKGNELIEVYPMTNEQKVVGKLKSEPATKLA
jgi:hypothetical protein